MSQNFKTLYFFGPYRLAPGERRLWRDGTCVHLTPKAFDLLVLLVRSAGHLQTREQLIGELWGNTVIEEHGLTWNVSALRRALGDGGEAPVYIETVRGHGYRFIAPVRTGRQPDTSPAPAPEQPVIEPAASRDDHAAGQATGKNDNPRQHTALRWLVAATLVILAANVVLAFRHRTSPAASQSTASPTERPTIAVVGFRNLSHDHDYDWIGDALTEMLGTELAAGNMARLSPPADVARVSHDLKLDDASATPTRTQWNQLRRLLGADASISGAYLREEDSGTQHIRVDVRMRMHDDRGRGGFVTVSATGDDLFAVVSSLGRKLRGRLGLGRLNPAQRGEFMASMPATTDAAADYASGLSALASGQTLLARTLLEHVTRKEPDFPLAHSALARAWLDLGDNLNAAREARLALRHSAGLSYTQRMLLLGLKAEADHQWSDASDAYQKLFDANPDSLNYGLMLARVQDKAGEYPAARDTLGQLGKLPAPFGNDPRVMLVSADLQANLGDYDACYRDAMRAARRANELGQDTMQARALSAAANARIHQNAFADALDLAGKARNLYAGDQADSLYAGINLQRIGNAYDGQGKYDKAVAAYDDANELFARIGNRYWQAASLNNMAGVYFRRDRLDLAQHRYEQALALFRDLHRDAAVAVVLNNLSTVVSGQGRLDQAIDDEKQSLAIRRELGAPRSIASTLFNLGLQSYALGRLDDAGNYLREARDIYLDQHAESDASDAVSALADLARTRNQLAEAHKGYEQALAMRQRHHVATSVAWSQRDLAELDLETGHPAHALRLLQAALPVFARAHERSDAMAARADLALALARLGRLDAARKQASLLDAGMATVSDRATRIGLKIARASLARRLGDTTQAETLLSSALLQAQRMKMKSRSYPARLELLRLHAGHGLDARVRAEGRTLVRLARHDGYLRIAAQAQAVLKRQSAPAARTASHSS